VAGRQAGGSSAACAAQVAPGRSQARSPGAAREDVPGPWALVRRSIAGGTSRPRRPATRRPLALFALSSVALLLLVAIIGAVGLRRLAEGEALNDARSVTAALSRATLRDAVTPAVLRGDGAALDALDRRVRQTVLGKPIVRIKIWAPDGRIIYSDARALIGERVPLPPDLRKALSDGGVRAEVTDLSRPENRLERGHGRLVEVYLPLRLAGGRQVVVEAYHPGEQIDRASGRIWGTFLPMFLGLLGALAAVQLPLAWAQSRRARRDAREREELARDAEMALQAERARIATELHDGIVQDLAGAAYALHAAAAMPADTSSDDLRGALRRGADVCRTSMTRMRELLVDLRAPRDGVQDLHGAIEGLARPLRDAGVEVIVGITLGRPLEPETALLIHRAAREILLTVRRRDDVSLITMALVERGQEVVLTVDHGIVGGGRQGEPDIPGRLQALAQRLSASGGSLAVDHIDGRRVRYAAALPVA
jgi:two-component system NarL family sensor kinase